MKVYYDRDADLNLITDKKIAIIIDTHCCSPFRHPGPEPGARCFPAITRQRDPGARPG